MLFVEKKLIKEKKTYWDSLKSNKLRESNQENKKESYINRWSAYKKVKSLS